MKVLLFPMLTIALFLGTMTFASAQSNSTDIQSNATAQSTDFSVKFDFSIGSGGSIHLSTPQGIASDSNGNIYVTDSHNNRIVKFDSKGNFLETIGSTGSGDGQLLFPIGVAVDKSGNIYVTDLDNFRIEKFDSSGNFMLKFSTNSSGQVSDPRGVAVDDSGNIYVSDLYNSIKKFDPSGNLIATIGDYEISGTQGIALDKSGNIYALDNGKPQVAEFSSDGTFIKEWGSICKISTKSWCTDPDGAGPFEIGDGQFYNANGIAVDDSGNVFVSDLDNNRVQIFDPSGHFFYKFGPGTGNDAIGDANGIAVYDGTIYVVDQEKYQVQVFDITYGNTTSAPNVVSTSPTMYPYTSQDAPGVPKVAQQPTATSPPTGNITAGYVPTFGSGLSSNTTTQSQIASSTEQPSTPQTTSPSTTQTTQPTTSQVTQPTTTQTVSQLTTVPTLSSMSSTIPTWVKGIFNYYGQGQMSDSELINAINFLVQQGIVKLK